MVIQTKISVLSFLLDWEIVHKMSYIGKQPVAGNFQKCDAITDSTNKKTSAKQKLQDLGLTVDEIKEAFGI